MHGYGCVEMVVSSLVGTYADLYGDPRWRKRDSESFPSPNASEPRVYRGFVEGIQLLIAQRVTLDKCKEYSVRNFASSGCADERVPGLLYAYCCPIDKN
jgi:hypothetical protein